MNRRSFLGLALAGLLTIVSPNLKAFENPLNAEKNRYSFNPGLLEKKVIQSDEFRERPDYKYGKVTYDSLQWMPASEGLEFARTKIYNNGKHVDTLAVLKINPEKNGLKVFNGFDEVTKYGAERTNNPLTLMRAGNFISTVGTIEDWQAYSGALAMINSAQYMGDAQYYCPIMAVLMDGKLKGPRVNKKVEGMLVSEPTIEGLQKIDLIDFKYDNQYNKFNPTSIPYREGVQHNLMILDRGGNIRISPSDWQANRTFVAKTKDNQILFITTEGGFFTLYNFGKFLKESNSREDKGLNIHTAMSMDGGYEANMIVSTPVLNYVTYGEFETYGPENDASVFNRKILIPGVIGVFPRR